MTAVVSVDNGRCPTCRSPTELVTVTIDPETSELIEADRADWIRRCTNPKCSESPSTKRGRGSKSAEWGPEVDDL